MYLNSNIEKSILFHNMANLVLLNDHQYSLHHLFRISLIIENSLSEKISQYQDFNLSYMSIKSFSFEIHLSCSGNLASLVHISYLLSFHSIHMLFIDK